MAAVTAKMTGGVAQALLYWRTRGIFQEAPMYDDGQHGGAVAGLFAHHLRAVPTLATMELSRLTLEIFRIVPTTAFPRLDRPVPLTCWPPYGNGRLGAMASLLDD